jgi:hypothetical protein
MLHVPLEDEPLFGLVPEALDLVHSGSIDLDGPVHVALGVDLDVEVALESVGDDPPMPAWCRHGLATFLGYTWGSNTDERARWYTCLLSWASTGG